MNERINIKTLSLSDYEAQWATILESGKSIISTLDLGEFGSLKANLVLKNEEGYIFKPCTKTSDINPIVKPLFEYKPFEEMPLIVVDYDGNMYLKVIAITPQN